VKERGRVVSDTRQFIWCPKRRKFMGELVRLGDEEGMNCADIRRIMVRHFRTFMGERFFQDEIAAVSWPAYSIARSYWREKQYRALPPFNPNTVLFSIFDPPKGDRTFRDIGRAEPSTTNPYPFLAINGELTQPYKDA
jgi:hypothetical protein